jgi:hypothetical protein
MKKLLSIFILSIFLAFGASMAMAATISINPTGELYALPGEEITFTVDFEADPAVAFGDAYAFNIGFDVAELSLVGWTNDLPGVDWGDFGTPEVGEGRIDNFNGYLVFGADLPMIGDVQLATVTFNLLPSASIDGSPDVWFINEPGLTTIGYIDPGSTMPTYHEVADITGHEGADVAAVPIPAAVWLLGSGLLGLVGIRRRAIR